MQEQYWLTKFSLNFSPKTGRTTIFTLQLRVIKHRLMFCKNLSSSSKKYKIAGKKLIHKKVTISVKADLICRFSLSLGPFEAILLFLVWKKWFHFSNFFRPYLSLLDFWNRSRTWSLNFFELVFLSISNWILCCKNPDPNRQKIKFANQIFKEQIDSRALSEAIWSAHDFPNYQSRILNLHKFSNQSSKVRFFVQAIYWLVKNLYSWLRIRKTCLEQLK